MLASQETAIILTSFLSPPKQATISCRMRSESSASFLVFSIFSLHYTTLMSPKMHLAGSSAILPLQTIIIYYMFRPFLGHHQGDNRYTRCIKHLYISSVGTAARAYIKHSSTLNMYCISISKILEN